MGAPPPTGRAVPYHLSCVWLRIVYMNFRVVLLFLLAFFCTVAQGQEPRSQDDQPHIRPKNMPKEEPPPPAKQPDDSQQGSSSSRDSEINLEGPSKTSGGPSDVHEMYPYDPHRAAKDVEVGEFYLKRKNYRAALDRFNDALLYKPNDAEATFRLAQTQEKLGLNAEASQNYSTYLKISPQGPFVKEAGEGLKRVGPPPSPTAKPSTEAAQLMQEGEAYLAKNAFDVAHEDFVKVLQINPDNPLANFRLAQSLQGLQRLDEARIFYKKYLSLDPNGKMASEAKREIGQIEMVLGK